MKNRIIFGLAFLLIGSFLSIYFSDFKIFKIKTEKEDSLSVAKVNSLEYTVKEFQQFRGDDAKLIDKLKIKPKNVQSVTNFSTETVTKINTIIQYVDTTKCLHYKDDFTSIDGCFKGDSIQLLVQNKDSLTTIVDKIPKHKFLFWQWGVKAVEINIVSKNPNTKFTYLKYIEL